MEAEYKELPRQGTQFVSGERFRRSLVPDIAFERKQANIAGLELADLCAAPIATQALKPGTLSPVWDAIHGKIGVGRGSRQGNVGLNGFPRLPHLDARYASLGHKKPQEPIGPRRRSHYCGPLVWLVS